jgi:hypothetical protein
VNPLLGLVLGDIDKSKLILDVILEEKETDEDEIFFLDESLQEYLNQTEQNNLTPIETFYKNSFSREIFNDVTMGFIPCLKNLIKNTKYLNSDKIDRLNQMILYVNKEIGPISRFYEITKNIVYYLKTLKDPTSEQNFGFEYDSFGIADLNKIVIEVSSTKISVMDFIVHYFTRYEPENSEFLTKFLDSKGNFL